MDLKVIWVDCPTCLSPTPYEGGMETLHRILGGAMANQPCGTCVKDSMERLKRVNRRRGYFARLSK